MSLALPALLALFLALSPASGAAAAAPVDELVELRPASPRQALEQGLSGPAAALYARAVHAVRLGQHHEALTLLRSARGEAFRVLQERPWSLGASRHFVRIAYAEEQLSDLVNVERALARRRADLSSEEHAVLLHERAMLAHNNFLLVRSFTGRADDRLLAQTQQLYEAVLERPSALRPLAWIHYAALLAERGQTRQAQKALAKVSADDLAAEVNDTAVAYYYLAQGDRGRAMGRLLQASHRESWDHPVNAREGRSARASVYRMNDFDPLRDHPLFQELVTQPEEALRRGRLDEGAR